MTKSEEAHGVGKPSYRDLLGSSYLDAPVVALGAFLLAYYPALV